MLITEQRVYGFKNKAVIGAYARLIKRLTISIKATSVVFYQILYLPFYLEPKFLSTIAFDEVKIESSLYYHFLIILIAVLIYINVRYCLLFYIESVQV
jgi:hypothetical protein